MGGGGKRATPEGVASSPRRDLPWPLSDIQVLSGRAGEVRECPQGYPNFRRTLPKQIAESAVIVRVYRTLCGKHVVDGKYDECHDSNGAYVAYITTPPTVFITCTLGGAGHRIVSTTDENGVEHCKVINVLCPVLEDRSVEPVTCVRGGFVHWAMLSKAELDGLVQGNIVV